MSGDYVYQKSRKNIWKKFGGKEKMSTFAIPNEKRVTEKALSLVLEVHWKDWNCTRSKYREKYNLSRSVDSFVRIEKCQWQAKSYIIIQWRVWSWLRMNASGRLNTCKSRGSMRRRFVEVLMATGARVRNAWATCPFQGDNRWKRRLIPHGIIKRHLLVIKEIRKRIGSRDIS